MRLICLLMTGALAFAGVPNDLEGFLRNLTVEARADRNGFAARLSTQFKVPGTQVQAVLGAVQEPGDAFLVLQLCQYTRLPHDRVLSVYRSHHHRGWGAMAHELGIKPGSREFKALKRGDYRLAPPSDRRDRDRFDRDRDRDRDEDRRDRRDRDDRDEHPGRGHGKHKGH